LDVHQQFVKVTYGCGICGDAADNTKDSVKQCFFSHLEKISSDLVSNLTSNTESVLKMESVCNERLLTKTKCVDNEGLVMKTESLYNE